MKDSTRSASFAALTVLVAGGVWFSVSCSRSRNQSQSFHIEEATIADIQHAIQDGRTTCVQVVQAYISRAKAYNGTCARLVTRDGATVAHATGAVRAGAPIVFPAETVPVSKILPDFDQYLGPPLDFGRMEATVSDPSVQQQYGMISGVPDAGQINALETLNIRGERSVTCKGTCDTHPSKGPLPANCPSVCEAFRRQPDALERAAELDAQYGTQPDLAKLPMYCSTFAVKDWYDVKDMRSTGGNDVSYAMDAPPRDSTVVAELREKGAIIYAVAIAAEAVYGSAGEGAPKTVFIGGGGSIRSSWGGQVCNPYDTERSAGPSSGGSGASVASNLVTCAVCETTGGSCREPANQNALVSLVGTKGLTSEDGTSVAQFINHRSGVLCRTLGDAARVLDAIKNPQTGYFDSRDMFTAIPKGLVAKAPYASFVVDPSSLTADAKPLKGMRVAIVREFMVKQTPNDAAISDLVDKEIKTVLRDRLGADVVESVDPKYPDDPAVPNMTYRFENAFAQTVAFSAPEYFFQMNGETPEFAVDGHDVRTRDYLVNLALGKAPLSDKLNLRRIQSGLDDAQRTSFSVAKYLLERGDAKISDWASYAANSKWANAVTAERTRNAAKENLQDLRAKQGVDRVKMHTVFRMAVLKTMRENGIDVFVHPNVGVPQWKIGIDREPTVDNRTGGGPAITDLLGFPEIAVPAGYNRIVYNPEYVLSKDKKSYTLVTGSMQSTLPNQMPVSINFWAGPGDEPTLLRVASAYEAATKHRVPPPAFGPVPSEP